MEVRIVTTEEQELKRLKEMHMDLFYRYREVREQYANVRSTKKFIEKRISDVEEKIMLLAQGQLLIQEESE